MRAFVWDLIRGGHYGQRPRVPRKKAEHTGAPTDAAAYMKKALANPEPSTHGGKADITVCGSGIRFRGRYWGQSGHRFLHCICRPKRTLRVDSIVVAAGRQRGVLSPKSSITPINALGPTFTVPENG